VTDSDHEPTILIARLLVKYGKLAQFTEAMARLVPVMVDSGWRLRVSYQTIIGNLHEVYDIWEIPSPNAVGPSLVAAATDSRFPEIGEALAASVETETLSVVVKTPFSP
jgi:hypothetical protein